MSFSRPLSRRFRKSFRKSTSASRLAIKRKPAFERSPLLPLLEFLEGRQLMSAIPVTSALDDVTRRGTLRYAVANAKNGDTILLTPGSITLTQGELLLGQQGLTIKSVGNVPVSISGNHLSRIFEVAPGASVTLSNLTLTGGNG